MRNCIQSQNQNLETQRDGAATKDKTFAPRSHRVTEKNKRKWVRAGPPGLRCIQNQGFDISNLIYAHQRTEATGMRLPNGSIAVPCTPFSDGEVKSKYRNPGSGYSEIPAVRHEPIYLLFFSVTLWLRGAKVWFFNTGTDTKA